MNLPPYDTFPNISGDKVSLRQIQPSDMPAIVDISFYDAVKASTTEEATEMQEKIIFAPANSGYDYVFDSIK